MQVVEAQARAGYRYRGGRQREAQARIKNENYINRYEIIQALIVGIATPERI
jgi:hypothetical protein